MVRFAGPGAAVAVVLLVGITTPAAADERPVEAPVPDSFRPAAAPVRDARPAALLPLYASFVTLQVLDFTQPPTRCRAAPSKRIRRCREWSGARSDSPP